MEFRAGEEMKQHTNFWVSVCNGERPSKAITEIHKRKIAVQVKVCRTLLYKKSGEWHKNFRKVDANLTIKAIN